MTAAGGRLVLEGVENFRDLGGYAADGGRRVRRGLLFRSDAPDGLTESDHEALALLGIRLVCDFRGGGEKRREGTRWRAPEPEYWPLPIVPGVNDVEFLQRLRDAPSPDTARAAMLSLYRGMPIESAGQYKALMARIHAGDLPLLFHCSAGKDRTGLFAALLLTALGAPPDVVMKDYLLSDEYLRDSRTVRRLVGVMQRLLGIEGSVADVVMPFLTVERQYLEAAFAAIAAAHGTVDRYLEEALGLDAMALAELRQRLLE
jgi:protein-tyrosine phosphatase